MNYIDNFILIVLPYLALATFLIGSIYRYRSRKFQVSSLSSQFLEGRKLFYGCINCCKTLVEVKFLVGQKGLDLCACHHRYAIHSGLLGILDALVE